MPRYLAVCAALAAASAVAVAQVTVEPTLPIGSGSPIYELGRDLPTPFSTEFGDNTPIPLEMSNALRCEIAEAPGVDKLVEEVTNLALAGAGGINKGDVSVSLIEVCPEPKQACGGVCSALKFPCCCGSRFGHLQGDQPRYAAGVARMFWATALLHGVQSKCIKVNPALESDLITMLHNADPMASNRIIDFVSGTTSGPNLGFNAFCNFAGKRDYANYVFSRVGFHHFNVNQKILPVSTGGRDLQLLGRKLVMNHENSNRVTTNQAAALMFMIDQEAIVSKCASRAMKAYMMSPLDQRKIDTLSGIAFGLPIGSQIISVNGYTNHNYHEVAKVTLPNGFEYVLAVFSNYRVQPTTFISSLSKILAHRYMDKTGDFDPEQYLTIPALASPVMGR
jgi:hypothetical protein